MSGIAFQNVAGLIPHKTRFDWFTSHKFDTGMGMLIPMFYQEMYPGETISISHQILVRGLPLINPLMHDIEIDTHYFFVATRTLDDTNSVPGGGNPKGDPLLLNGAQPPIDRFNFELFITGGHDGMDNQEYPRWIPSEEKGEAEHEWVYRKVGAPYQYSLWDYFKLPILEHYPSQQGWHSSETPIDDLRRAYNYIFNTYYRDQTHQATVPWTNEHILLRNWRKDYFTSSLPFQQRGIAPAIPIDLSPKPYNIDETTLNSLRTIIGGTNQANSNIAGQPVQGVEYPNGNYFLTSLFSHLNATSGAPYNSHINTYADPEVTSYSNANKSTELFLKGLTRQIQGTSINVSDLREVVQLQKFLERNARAGARINEFTKAHWGVSMGDDRIGRPEYIGGTKQPLIISEVLQTSASNQIETPLGTMGGHSISADGEHVGSYHAVEWGWVIGIMSIMPKAAYHQGIKRNLLKKTNLSWYSPEFANLSEQDIIQAELYINNDSTDSRSIGFQGVWDEYRTQESTVCGAFHNMLRSWHLTRHFDVAPNINEEFIQCNPNKMNQVFQVNNIPQLLCDVEHNFHMIRPMPEIAEPGLLDHH